MKLTVFSDSHGNMENVLRIFDDSPADRYLFCGDGLTDAEDAAHLRDVPLTAVAGNCDYGSTARTEWLLELEGVRILLTHGHGYAVNQGTGALLRRARELEAQVVLFGHTHQRLLEEAGGRALLSFTIHEGKKRQIRRMCARAGLAVRRLCRVAEAGIPLGTLREGAWRPLTQEEIETIMGKQG